MRKGIEANFKGFTAIHDAGRLIGPWKSLAAFSEVRRTGLGTGQGPVQFTEAAAPGPRDRHPRYRRALSFRLPDLRACARCRIARNYRREDSIIIAGQRSDDLTREEGSAYDLASALVSGRVLQPLTYQQVVTLFGEEATEFIYLVGL